ARHDVVRLSDVIVDERARFGLGAMQHRHRRLAAEHLARLDRLIDDVVGDLFLQDRLVIFLADEGRRHGGLLRRKRQEEREECRHARTLLQSPLMRYLAAALAVALAVPAFAQDEPARRPAARKDGPWFGVTLPPKTGAAAAVKVGTRPPRPTTPDTTAPEFAGAAIKADVETIVGFAKA